MEAADCPFPRFRRVEKCAMAGGLPTRQEARCLCPPLQAGASAKSEVDARQRQINDLKTQLQTSQAVWTRAGFAPFLDVFKLDSVDAS